MNEFLSKITNEVFSRLHPRFQILDNIPLRMARKREKCYSRWTVDVGFYKAIFLARLRLPPTELHRQLADHLGVSVSQIYHNAWRIFLRAEVLWGQISWGCCRLTLDKLFFCCRAQQLVASKGFYNFIVRKPSLKQLTNVPDSNHNWKSRYFFVQCSNWVCRPSKWDSIGKEYDNTWGILDEFSESSVIARSICTHFFILTHCVLFFNPSALND